MKTVSPAILLVLLCASIVTAPPGRALAQTPPLLGTAFFVPGLDGWGLALGPDGNLYSAQGSSVSVNVYSPQLGLLRQVPGAPAPPLMHSSYTGIAVASSGEIYVVDTGGNRILVFGSDGTLLRSWGGTGSGDGQFNQPYGVALDGLGQVYVADTYNSRVQKFTLTGSYVDQFGGGLFQAPYGIAVDAAGSIYVSDTGNHEIMKLGPDGSVITRWGPLRGLPGELGNPYALWVGAGGVLYVADNDRTVDGVKLFSTEGAFLGGWAYHPGSAYSCPQFAPVGVAVSPGGVVYASDHCRVVAFSYSPVGARSGTWGGLKAHYR